MIGESGGELSALATPETGNKAVEEEEDRLGHFSLFLLKYLEKVIGKTTIRLIILIVLSAASVFGLTQRVRFSVDFCMCAIMKFTKYGKHAYFGECFIGLLTNWYILPHFFIIYLDSVDNLTLYDIVVMTIWRQRNC